MSESDEKDSKTNEEKGNPVEDDDGPDYIDNPPRQSYGTLA